MKTAIFIPSRIGSTRLPNKALADIHGKPMIVHVLEKAKASGIASIYVATDHNDIKLAVESAGGVAIMTDPELPSGTDRIFAASQIVKNKYDIIVNLQGDMPNIKPSIIHDVISVMQNSGDSDIATAVIKISNPDDIHNPNVVKPALALKGGEKFPRAIYFSRAPIPTNPGNQENAEHFHHIGIYAYTPSSLQRFVSLGESYLEKREKLEQLRALEYGMTIRACIVQDMPISIDTKEDLERIRKIVI